MGCYFIVFLLGQILRFNLLGLQVRRLGRTRNIRVRAMGRVVGPTTDKHTYERPEQFEIT